MRFDHQFNQQSDLIAYLQGNTVLSLESFERTTVGGLDAAVARAVVHSGGETFEVYLTVIRVSPDTVFRFSFSVPSPTSESVIQQVRESSASFRLLTLAEALQWAPLRLKVVTADENTTVESLAAQMQVLDRPMMWLLMLNGLEPGAELHQGQKLKIVVQ